MNNKIFNPLSSHPPIKRIDSNSKKCMYLQDTYLFKVLTYV